MGKRVVKEIASQPIRIDTSMLCPLVSKGLARADHVC